MTDVLDVRTLNRTLLRRQMLLKRADMRAAAMIEHLIALQAQQPAAPYFGLWTRLESFKPDELSQLISERAAVRLKLMRGTVHLATGADALALRPWLEPIYDGHWRALLGKRAAVQDVEEFAAAVRAMMEERPRTNAELREALGERWDGIAAGSIASAAGALLPLVQVPPRGLWGKSGQASHTPADLWLGRSLDAAPDAGELIRRYLGAFGPASVKDMQTWSGLTRLREVVDALDLREFRDEQGTVLFDVSDGVWADPSVDAPVRFLPAYDNVLRSHADRTRVMTLETRRALDTPNDAPMPTFLVDGFVRGIWRLTQKRGEATLRMQPFWPLGEHEDAVMEEATRLLEFAAPEGVHTVEISSDRP